jgi:hypothetical protein
MLVNARDSIDLSVTFWGADYEKPMRTWHKHSWAQWSTGWVWHIPSRRRERRQNAAQLLFLSCLCSEKGGGTQVSCSDVTPLPKNYFSTSSFTTQYKRLPEGGHEAFWWNWIGLMKHFWRWMDGLIGRWLARGLLLNDAAAAAELC